MLAVRSKAVESQPVQQVLDHRPREHSGGKQSGKTSKPTLYTRSGASREQNCEDAEPHPHTFSIRSGRARQMRLC